MSDKRVLRKLKRLGVEVKGLPGSKGGSAELDGEGAGGGGGAGMVVMWTDVLGRRRSLVIPGGNGGAGYGGVPGGTGGGRR